MKKIYFLLILCNMGIINGMLTCKNYFQLAQPQPKQAITNTNNSSPNNNKGNLLEWFATTYSIPRKNIIIKIPEDNIILHDEIEQGIKAATYNIENEKGIIDLTSLYEKVNADKNELSKTIDLLKINNTSLIEKHGQEQTAHSQTKKSLTQEQTAYQKTKESLTQEQTAHQTIKKELETLKKPNFWSIRNPKLLVSLPILGFTVATLAIKYSSTIRSFFGIQ